MSKQSKKVIKAIEKLQKYRADNDIPQNDKSYKAIHALRQVGNQTEDTKRKDVRLVKKKTGLRGGFIKFAAQKNLNVLTERSRKNVPITPANGGNS